jgi:FkbM family methyltransferase
MPTQSRCGMMIPRSKRSRAPISFARSHEVSATGIKYYFKEKLPPNLRRWIRTAFYRARGITTERLTHETVAALIGKPDPIILEIGCNDGNDTLGFLRAIPRPTIYCFEPDARAIARFKARMGPELGKVNLIEVAISDRAGQIEFHASDGGDLPEGWDQSGSIRRPKNHTKANSWVKFEKTVSVNTCRLDDWCADSGVTTVDFIWMDVQGAEGDVIGGGAKTLQATRYLYTEYSNDELYEGQLSLKGLLARLPAFEVVRRYPGDVLLKNKLLS